MWMPSPPPPWDEAPPEEPARLEASAAARGAPRSSDPRSLPDPPPAFFASRLRFLLYMRAARSAARTTMGTMTAGATTEATLDLGDEVETDGDGMGRTFASCVVATKPL